MNRLTKFSLLLFLITALVLALPGPVYAQTPGNNDSPVIFGSDYVLTAGHVIKDLVVFGGNATIEQGAQVTSDVVVFGGKLVIAGEVDGDVTTFGGDVNIFESALIGGNLSTLGGNAQIASGATIKGNRVTGVGALPLRIPTMIYTPTFWVDFGPGASFISAVFGALILALLAVLIALFLPVPTDRVARTIGTQPVISGAVGLLTLIVIPALFMVLAVTVILIPLGLIGLLVFGIALLFGWVAIGLEFGKRMTGLVNAQWAVPVSAGVGTLVLSLITNLVLVVTGSWFWTLCCIGIPLVGLLGMVGLGGVVASRFGAQVYNPNPPRPPAPQAPYYPSGNLPPAPTNWPPQPPVQDYSQPPAPPAGWTPQPPAPQGQTPPAGWPTQPPAGQPPQPPAVQPQQPPVVQPQQPPAVSPQPAPQAPEPGEQPPQQPPAPPVEPPASPLPPENQA